MSSLVPQHPCSHQMVTTFSQCDMFCNHQLPSQNRAGPILSPEHLGKLLSRGLAAVLSRVCLHLFSPVAPAGSGASMLRVKADLEGSDLVRTLGQFVSQCPPQQHRHHDAVLYFVEHFQVYGWLSLWVCFFSFHSKSRAYQLQYNHYSFPFFHCMQCSVTLWMTLTEGRNWAGKTSTQLMQRPSVKHSAQSYLQLQVSSHCEFHTGWLLYTEYSPFSMIASKLEEITRKWIAQSKHCLHEKLCNMESTFLLHFEADRS